jgi:hypothetical protein
MSLPLVDRTPTANEIEKLRLILSTYQDGTGMLIDKKNKGMTLPGWRDFERSVALAFHGEAQESKAIFDVLLEDSDNPNVKYGLSCKMGDQLDRIDRTNRGFMELSNSSKKFWDYLLAKEIPRESYKNAAEKVGVALLELVEQWHHEVSIENGGKVNTLKSSYFVLAYNKAGWYQLYQFPLQFPELSLITWKFTVRNKDKTEIIGNLRGYDPDGMLFEWYGDSGGQLKYYPHVKTARWSSDRFKLEPLAHSNENGVLEKVKRYFPDLWQRTL